MKIDRTIQCEVCHQFYPADTSYWMGCPFQLKCIKCHEECEPCKYSGFPANPHRCNLSEPTSPIETARGGGRDTVHPTLPSMGTIFKTPPNSLTRFGRPKNNTNPAATNASGDTTVDTTEPMTTRPAELTEAIDTITLLSSDLMALANEVKETSHTCVHRTLKKEVSNLLKALPTKLKAVASKLDTAATHMSDIQIPSPSRAPPAGIPPANHQDTTTDQTAAIQKLTAAVRQLQDTVYKQNKSNDQISTKGQPTTTRIPQKSKNPTRPKTTYSAVLTGNFKDKPVEPILGSSLDFAANRVPPPVRIRKVKDREAVVSFERAEDRDRMVSLIAANKNSTITAKPKKMRRPLILITSIPQRHSHTKVLECVRNSHSTDAIARFQDTSARVAFPRKTRDAERYSLVLEVDPALRKAIKSEQGGYVFIDEGRYRVIDFSVFSQCSHCLSFGHTNKQKCRGLPTVCQFCAGDHHSDDCHHKTEANHTKKCHNCSQSNLNMKTSYDTKHHAKDGICPVRIKAQRTIESSVDYGD